MCTKIHNHMKYSSWELELDNFFVLLGHFLPFYPHPPNNPENQNFEKMKKASGDIIISNLCNKKHNHMMYAYLDMECDKQFFVILSYFWLFYPTIDPKNKNLEKMKKTPGDIILLYLCTINQDHMMYGSWDIKCKEQSFFVILDHFCPLTLLTIQKIKILKK